MSPKIVLYNKLASVFLQNITTCRFVVYREPPESTGSSCSASYSHRVSLVVHEVSFPGNTSNLQAPVRLCLGMLSPDRKQKQMMQVHVFLQRSMPCKRSKTPSTEKQRSYRKNSHLTQRQYVALLPHKQQNTTGYGSVKNKNNTSV